MKQLDSSQYLPKQWSYAQFVVMAVVMVGALLWVDTFIDGQQKLNSFTRWAYLDGVGHGGAALAVTAPLWLRYPIKQWVVYFLVAGLLGGLIDLDHFISAGSMQLQDVVTLPTRPPSHSLTFAIALAAAGFALTRDRIMAWVIFVTLASHVVRDASGFHTPILWPLNEPHNMPYWLYLALEVVLLYASFMVAKRVPPRHSSQR